MAAARPHPPSSRRDADARAAGHLPRAPLVGFAAGLLALLAMVGLLGERVTAVLEHALRAPFELAAAGKPRAAQDALALDIGELSGLIALCVLAMVAVIALTTWLVQGPSAPGDAHRASFARLRPSRLAGVLWVLGLTTWVGFYLAEAVSLELPAFAPWGWALALLSAACLLIDAALSRARWLSSLWLTRREYLDEQRDAGAGPARAEARRRARAEDPT